MEGKNVYKGKGWIVPKKGEGQAEIKESLLED